MRWRHLLSIVWWFGGWLGVVLFIVGIPGHIDDTTTWLRWSKMSGVSITLTLVSVGLVLTGPLLWTSGWWFPRLLKWWNRDQRAPTALAQPNEDLAKFRACLPHVQRCRKLISPYTGTLGTVDIALQVLRIGSATFGEIATELEYLAKQLSVLGIQSPDIWGEVGNDSFDKVHFRLRAWSSHLARLEAKIHQEDLKGARFQQE